MEWKVVKLDGELWIARLTPPQVPFVCWSCIRKRSVLKHAMDWNYRRTLVWRSEMVSIGPAVSNRKEFDCLWIGDLEFSADWSGSEHSQGSGESEELHDLVQGFCVVVLTCKFWKVVSSRRF